MVPKFSEDTITVRAMADKSGVWNIRDHGTHGSDSPRESVSLECKHNRSPKKGELVLGTFRAKAKKMASQFFKKLLFFSPFVSNVTGCFPLKKISPFFAEVLIHFQFQLIHFYPLESIIDNDSCEVTFLLYQSEVCIY